MRVAEGSQRKPLDKSRRENIAERKRSQIAQKREGFCQREEAGEANTGFANGRRRNNYPGDGYAAIPAGWLGAGDQDV
jgi:hypothetical protein